MNDNCNDLDTKGVVTKTAQAIQNPVSSVGGNDLLFTRRCKGALRSDKNEGKAKGWRFYQPTLPESLQQNRAGLSIGFWCLFFGSLPAGRQGFFGQTKK